MFQLGNGINYLHNLGIIHRDINPNNIIVNDVNDKIYLKIIDLSSSKTIGKEDNVDEMTGNFLYSAPEIIKRIHYDYKVDVWSIGVTLFYILSRNYPFESEKNKLGYLGEIIRNNFQINFNQNYWENRSIEVINLISLCLDNVIERLNIDQFLNHCWFKKWRKLVQLV